MKNVGDSVDVGNSNENKCILVAKNITKTYPGGITANQSISLCIRKGEVLAILGENGAGKTTFVSILSGIIRPDSGYIIYKGRKTIFKNPREAQREGIVLVPQNPILIEELKVYENLLLSCRLAGLRYTYDEIVRKVNEISRLYNIHVDVNEPVWKLSFGERQRVEIVKALILNAQILILDEPTTHLSPLESHALIEILKKISREGKTVIFISHKIKEALSVADRIAVMRSGKLVGIVDANTASVRQLLQLMFGDRILHYKPLLRETPTIGKEPVLVVQDLWVRGLHGTFSVKGVSFRVNKGEIVGIAGVAGNGQRELFEAIVGLRKPVKGSIKIYNAVSGINVNNYGDVAIIPEERLGWGLVPDKDLVFNAALGLYRSSIGPYKSVFVDWKQALIITNDIIKKYQVVSPSARALANSLSGGNMQKFIVGRELSKNPKLVVAMNPTAGLDVSSATMIRQIFIEIAKKGTAILLFSEDLDELVEVSDRILVMNKGSINHVEEKPFNVEAIARAMVSSA